ncbi:MAG: serine/threonine protein kinase, partial [Glaciihabitans sp.]
TASDLDERTQVRAAVVANPTARSRRRRSASGTGTATGWQGSEAGGAASATAPVAGPSRRMTAMIWAMVSVATLLIAAGATVTVVLVRAAGAATIPTVSNVQASSSGGSVEFSWPDPGLSSRDSYRIETGDGASSIQRATSFVVDAAPGSRVCLTVTVTRDGKSGTPSGEKCVDVAE